MSKRDLYIKARATSAPAEDWVRPSDWLAMPTGITSADQTFVGLHAVIEDNDNYVAFLFTTSAGQYQVDWGDGSTPTLHNSNTIAQYQYDFATVSSSTLTSRGYKQAIITVTPVSGNFLTCDFQRRFVTSPVQNQAYSTGFLDCILSIPNANTGASIILGGVTVRHSYCERFDIKTIGNATSCLNLFNNFGLHICILFNTLNVTNMQSMFSNCRYLRNIPLFNTSNVTNMQSMFQLSSLRTIPLLNTSNVTNMAQAFSGCDLNNIPLIDTSNVTNIIELFRFCANLNSIPALSTASITTTTGSNFSNFAADARSLNRCEMVFAQSVTLTSCQLSRDALVEIFTNLVDRSATTAANINITGNWGASALTVGERLIATAKNWTITG
jgi:surface protein